MVTKLIDIMPVVIALLTFFTVVIGSVYFRPGVGAVVKTYQRIDHRLREINPGFLNYEKIQRFLVANGASFHYGKKITPIKYCLLCAGVGIGCFAFGVRINVLAALVLMMLGVYAPKFYLIRANRQDNSSMILHLQGLYSALQEQIKAGVFVTDALAECYRGINAGRLRTALEELSAEILLQKSFPDALEHFNDKFSNPAIDSLCVILLQAQESGQSVDLLKDMAVQIKDLQAALLLKKKERLNRIETVCILGIMSVIIGLIIYACLMTMFHSVNNL